MTVKNVATLAVALLIVGGQTAGAGNSAHAVELATGKTEIHLVGTGKNTIKGQRLSAVLKKALSGLSSGATAPTFQISWVEDRELLINPLLSRKVFDFGFGFEKPDCSIEARNELCNNFFFSQEILPASSDNNSNALYAVIAKTHPRARTLLYYLNTALKGLPKKPEARDVVSRQPEKTSN